MANLRSQISRFVLSLASFTAIGCSPDAPPESRSAAPSVTIRGAGSTFVAPLFKAWFIEYHRTHPETVVEYAGVGSGEGTKRFLNNDVDFAASDSALTDEQIASVKRGVALVPITAGIIVLAYNPQELPSGLRLPRNIYVDIFLGKITRWDDPRIVAANPGQKMPPREIAVVARQDSSGTTFALTNHFAAVSSAWKAGPGIGKSVDWAGHALRAQGNEGVAALIQRTPAAIGYVEYGAAKQIGLGMATLQNRAGNYVKPTGTSGLDTLVQTEMPANLRVFMPDPDGKESYPIVTYSWLLLYRHVDDKNKLALLKDVAQWCLGNGQQFSEPLGYIRLPPHVISLATNAVENVGP